MAAHRVDPTGPKEGGFTLIEVMIAILLSALTVIGMVGLFRVETRASGFSRRGAEAAVLAQDKLEELRTTAAATVLTTTTETGLDSAGQAGGPFTRTWAMTPAGDVVDISVTVEWDDGTAVRTVTVHGKRGAS